MGRLLILLAMAVALCGGCADFGASEYEAPAPAGLSTDVAGWDVGRNVLAFTHPDCAPCREARPMLENIRRQSIPQGVDVIEVDATEHPELVERFGVKRYPTYVLVEDGEVRGIADNIKLLLKLLKLAFFVVMFFI